MQLHCASTSLRMSPPTKKVVVLPIRKAPQAPEAPEAPEAPQVAKVAPRVVKPQKVTREEMLRLRAKRYEMVKLRLKTAREAKRKLFWATNERYIPPPTWPAGTPSWGPLIPLDQLMRVSDHRAPFAASTQTQSSSLKKKSSDKGKDCEKSKSSDKGKD